MTYFFINFYLFQQLASSEIKRSIQKFASFWLIYWFQKDYFWSRGAQWSGMTFKLPKSSIETVVKKDRNSRNFVKQNVSESEGNLVSENFKNLWNCPAHCVGRVFLKKGAIHYNIWFRFWLFETHHTQLLW